MQHAADVLAKLNPDFMTVTYGAGGSTRQQTKELVLEFAKKYPFPVKAHITCVGSNRAEVDALAEEYWNAGIYRLVVLRGDNPGGGAYVPHPDGYDYAVDLVKGLRKLHDFDITVAAYPEGHPEAPSTDFDVEYLKQKLDAGASRAISQFFFDPEVFLRFRDKAAKFGIEEQIIPGILPILDVKRAENFARKCGASFPSFLEKMFEGVESRTVDHQLLAMNVLSHQITRLIQEGVHLFHFYTLNETMLTQHICTWLRNGF